MPGNAVLSIRLGEQTKERLERLAAATRRSKSFLAAEAIKEFLAVQEWQIAGIEKAMASADSGQLISHEDVADWIASLGGDDELPAG